jgi:hypothetical protein
MNRSIAAPEEPGPGREMAAWPYLIHFQNSHTQQRRVGHPAGFVPAFAMEAIPSFPGPKNITVIVIL